MNGSFSFQIFWGVRSDSGEEGDEDFWRKED